MNTLRSDSRRRERRWVPPALIGVALVVIAGLVGFGWLGQRMAHGYLHPRRILPASDPAAFAIDYQDITLVTSDGMSLAAWYTPPQNGIVILAAHGHASARLADVHAMFASHGYGVLSWDFRAHGASGGDFTSLGYFEQRDVAAALDYARSQLGIDHVAIWGQSMGAATALLFAAEEPDIEAVIADSAYTSLAETIDTAVPIAVLRPFIRPFAEAEAGVSADSVRPIDAIARLAPRPVFLIDNEFDEVVPPHSGQRLYAAAGDPKVYWLIRGAGHVRGRLLEPDEYEARVLEFLRATFEP